MATCTGLSCSIFPIPGNGTDPDEVPEEARLIDSWFLMSSPYPIATIVATYLYFVLKLGPQYMSFRKPYDLKYIMMAYNLFQVVYNAWLFQKVFHTQGAITYIVEHTCMPADKRENFFLRNELFQAAWYYFFSKLADLLDTIFFVLRKKQSHVSFLHVYHHSMMLVSTWAYLKYIRGEQAGLIGLINSGVHVAMYSYYFLAALGPAIQPYLWWKKYITKLQLAQFIFIICLFTCLTVFNCEMPRKLTYYIIANGFVFLYLFTQFYFRSYLNKKQHSS
ncbi:elongation of very long chain fatty acids protein AAEL008004 [Nilaparvata lugens]|uniref:Elongation of very long chain fatty acids protein n=1 Tax=Nilaparvata lugens TaxID=108931 RepID=A0A3Q8FVI2_NILLU|nr:elongation of very long chain fatty acids protein AAEL008004 [Nilaparvata lugens]XP_039282289.1 elongation of very long chain fatty acids protein AAEL008004 [Nilaparvata lugens]AWJ25039.1 fatty acid elongase [Nilaparvata lugens]